MHSRQSALGFAACLILVWTGSTGAADPPAKSDEFFEKAVRPVLVNHCFECHGPQKQKGGLRLDGRDGMLTGGDTGPVIVPGHPEQSLLIKAIGYKDELRMPPKGALAPAQVAALTTWVK